MVGCCNTVRGRCGGSPGNLLTPALPIFPVVTSPRQPGHALLRRHSAMQVTYVYKGRTHQLDLPATATCDDFKAAVAQKRTGPLPALPVGSQTGL
jgi:hypothetical protein